VILVGGGPGAPDLVTLRGARALAAADVVVYDALAPADLLELAPPHAERINVGKRGHDAPTRSQEDIGKLLVERARAGQVVVRLKGGDPFVFGRGGEEASACRAAGVPFEVVPGVSAALGAPAFAGIPVTDRRHAASFAVVTGHKDPTRVREALRWEDLGRAVDTLVILMGMRNLAEIAERLVAGGRDAATPAAVIEWGSTGRQRVMVATLADVAARAREAGLGAPATVVVGDVVRLRAELAWFEALPLFGMRVAVTRAAGQAGSLERALREAGAEPVALPAIETRAVRSSPEIDAVFAVLPDAWAVVLASANAARAWAERAQERGVAPVPAGATLWCVGPATAEAAREAGLPALRPLPAERARAEDLLGALRAEAARQAPGAEAPLAGRCVVLPRAAHGREVLARGLREAGARVVEAAVYRTDPVPGVGAAVDAALRAGRLDALLFASPSAVRAVREGLSAEGLEAARRAWIGAIGPTTAEALRESGLAPDAVPERHTAEDLVAALAARVAEGRGPAGGGR
jgi:uroporphyrinogen III methyltransferase/synthase